MKTKDNEPAPVGSSSSGEMPREPATPEALWVDLKAVRTEVGLTQKEFADMIGVSVRTVQSCEQGWRNPSQAVEKAALLLLLAKRTGADCRSHRCWEAVDCSGEEQSACLVFQTRQGHLCWLLSGNLCQGVHLHSWEIKKVVCTRCSFFAELLPEGVPMRPDLRNS